MTIKAIIIVVICCVTYLDLKSNDNIDNNLENILETLSYENSFSTDLDEIEYLHNNPIYLKEANFNDLIKIPGFSSSEIIKILKLTYEDSISTFEKLFENINLTAEQKFLLTYCCTFKKYNLKELKTINYRIRNKYYLILPKAYEENKLLGNPLDLYNRVNINFEKFQFNLITDKDFGEKSLTDLNSANLKFETKNFKIILGDYLITQGMGNVLWKPFSLRKGFDVISPAVQYNNDILSYKSSMDYYFKRGLAAKYSYELFPDKDLEITAWYSNKKLSSNIDTNLIFEKQFINEYASSIYKAGYFRTQNENNKRNNLNEKMLGFSLIWDEPNYNVGILFNRLIYDKFIYTKSSTDIVGYNQNFYSLFGKLDFNNYFLMGEFSLNDYRNLALKISLNKMSEQIEYVIGVRDYQSNFKSPYGMTYGERSYPNNEIGLYLSLRYFIAKNIILSGYLDFYNSDSDDLDNKYSGNEILTRIDWNFKKRTKFYAIINYENKNEYSQKKNLNKHTYKIRLNLDYDLTNFLKLRLRTESCFYNEKISEQGNLIRFDIKYSFDKYYGVGLTYSLFNTDSYYSAIWQYEMPVNGYMTTIPLYGKGMRSTLYFTTKLLDCIKIKIAGIFYIKNNVDNMGSGLLEIKDNKDIRILSQIEFEL